MRREAPAGSILAVVFAATLLEACGVPVSGTVHSIGPADVPPAFTAPTDPGAIPPAAGEPAVYFADARGHLVASPVRVLPGTSSATLSAALQAMLAQLTAGPSTEQSGRGLATALPPAITLHVVDVTDQRARQAQYAPTAPAGSAGSAG